MMTALAPTVAKSADFFAKPGLRLNRLRAAFFESMIFPLDDSNCVEFTVSILAALALCCNNFATLAKLHVLHREAH